MRTILPRVELSSRSSSVVGSRRDSISISTTKHLITNSPGSVNGSCTRAGLYRCEAKEISESGPGQGVPGLGSPSNKVLSPPTSCYPGWLGRTPSVHKRRQCPEYAVTELIRMNPLHLFFLGFIPPFFGAVGSIITALLLHNDEISNYNWQCGRARLPSLSRIINLPMERVFWQFTFLFHIPLRAIELGVGFFRYGRLRSLSCRWPRFYTLNRYLYAIFGVCELIFMIALSVVGEREFISYHVIFFYAFGCFAFGHFLTNAICHANSLYYLNPYGRISYHIKIVVSVFYFISIPILFGAFILYWKKCITIMYDIFAITEYVDVFLTIAYHCCAFYDIRYKVIFSIRDVRKIKYG